MAVPVAAVERAPIDWEVPEQQVGLWSDAWQRFRRNRLDILGRDTLSRLMLGSQVSLTVGLLVQGIIFPIGLAIGLTAGYFGGRIDNLLMRFTDIWYAFPDLLFVLVVVSVFGPSLLTIFGAIALVNWVGLARLVRGQVLSIKEKEFIEAARSSGSSP